MCACVCLCVPVQRRGREGREGSLRMAQVGLRVVLLTYDEPLAPASSWCFLTIRAQSLWWLWGQLSSGESPDAGTGGDGDRKGMGSRGKAEVGVLLSWALQCHLTGQDSAGVPFTDLPSLKSLLPLPHLLSEQPDLSFTSLYTAMVYSSASHTRL